VVTKAAKSRRKINAKTLLTLAFSCSLGLLIVLVFLAFDFYRADARLEVRDVVSTSIHELDKRLGWKLKADSCCRHAKNGNFDVTYTVDAEGFRKTGRALSPTFSITFYGDSYTFGHGVDDAETFASLIANVYLTEDVAVYNAAVNGYGIVQMYQQLLSHLDRIGPGDVVVFTPTSADIERNVKDFVFPYTCAFRRGENQVPIEYYPAYANGRITYTKLERTLWNKLKLLALTAPGARGLWHVIHNRFKPDTTQEALEMVRSARLETERRGGRVSANASSVRIRWTFPLSITTISCPASRWRRVNCTGCASRPTATGTQRPTAWPPRRSSRHWSPRGVSPKRISGRGPR